MTTTYRTTDGGYYRHEGGATTHLEHKDDQSARHITYPTGYDPKCSWCWLGYGHSEEAHAARISQ